MVQEIQGIAGHKPVVSGRVGIPASKSHTVRALLIAAFAGGESRLRRPLVSQDALSCRKAVETLGAKIREDGDDWIVSGFGPVPKNSPVSINVGNSGTTLYLSAALASLSDQAVTFDGDAQIRRRSARPLLDALESMRADVSSPNGCAPFSIRGPVSACSVSVDCPVSQYLSALLLTAPLIRKTASESQNFTTIRIRSLNEAPYVEMTLDWLKRQNIRYERSGWEEFRIPCGQSYQPFDQTIPADWSSAAFFMAAAAITGGTLILDGLEMSDSQGDKAVAGMLEEMGCLCRETEGGIQVTGRPMRGRTLDLNATPDALPALAVTACFAEGETRLINVPQARMKETDRIAVMTGQIRLMGGDAEELPDGMIIRGRSGQPGLNAAQLDGHGDHRVVMALAAAALGAEGRTRISGAEAADITFPGFFDLLERCLNG